MSYEILERNIGALLRQSYRPTLPTPLFRDRLRARFQAELERRHRPRRLPRLALVLAAAVVLVLAALRVLAPDGPASREELVREGAVALGFPDGSWRAADEEELVHGHRVTSATLLVATPRARGLELLVDAGRLSLGAAALLEVALEPAPRALLRTGAAEFRSGAERRALQPGVELALVPLSGSTDAGQTASSGREDLAPTPATAPSDPVAPEARTLRGRVVRASDGAPVQAFTVGLLRERLGNATYPPTTRAFESADGTFEWRDTPGKNQRVFVHAEGFALAALGEHDLELGLELEARLAEGVTLSGSVSDEQGQPVAGALIVAEDETPTDGLLFAQADLAYWLPVQARSGLDGRFELHHAGPGTHVLRASAEGFAPAWKLQARPGSEQAFVLERGGTLVGRVSGADGGPVAGAELVVVAMEQPALPRTNFARTLSDLDGRYRVEHLPPLTMIAVLLRDGRPDVRPLQVLAGAEVRVDFATPLAGLSLSGRVLDGEGRPLAQQNLGLFDRREATWSSEWIASTTDDQGRYLFEGLEPGEYLVFLIDELGQGLRCVDDFALSDELHAHERDIHVPGCELVVRLRSERNGAPVAGAALLLDFLEPGGAEHFAALGVSGPDGAFRFAQQRPGRYRLGAYPGDGQHGYRSGAPVELGAEPVTLDLALPPGGSATVQVRTPEGRPLARARVRFAAEDGQEHSFSQVPETDSSGLFRAVGLVPGTYHVRVTFPGYRTVERPLPFELGQEPRLEIVMDPLPAAPR